MESNVKRRYLQRLLGQQEDDEEQGLVLQKDCERLEEVRGARKDELKGKKQHAEELKIHIGKITKDLDIGSFTLSISPA